jgi:nucleoside-triphosphatase THEP1
MEGYYSTEIRKDNELIGYNINFINGETIEFARKDFTGKLSFLKYAIKDESFDKITQKIQQLIKTSHKIIVIEIGAMFIMKIEFIQNLLKILSTDKKMIIFLPKNKEILQTIKNLDDSFMMELTKKDLKSIKKAVDKWLGALISRIEINE